MVAATSSNRPNNTRLLISSCPNNFNCSLVMLLLLLPSPALALEGVEIDESRSSDERDFNLIRSSRAALLGVADVDVDDPGVSGWIPVRPEVEGV